MINRKLIKFLKERYDVEQATYKELWDSYFKEPTEAKEKVLLRYMGRTEILREMHNELLNGEE